LAVGGNTGGHIVEGGIDFVPHIDRLQPLVVFALKTDIEVALAELARPI
jgi:riboflavin synthase alpha subunit